ncbi:hypothetical protein GGF46_001925 [Coemansia sp. RSA 552]|nr:hypothetical protein GGF46_001925 [Coemansia sp. RSA 552]
MTSSVKANAAVPYISRRSSVFGTRFMVASTQPLASQAGARVLERGGNAADAAVAVAAALGVVEPFSTGLGGDCFGLFYDARTKRVEGLNGSGRAPAALTIDRLANEFGIDGKIPDHSVHGVTVPGAAAGWVDTVEWFGSGRVSLADVLAPAIELARDGFPVGELTSPFWCDAAEVVRTASPDCKSLLLDDGQGPGVGQVMRNPDLAAVMEALGRQGASAFYEGRVADAIVQGVAQHGGVLTHGDLRAHRSTRDRPISYEWRGGGRRVYECAPNGAGLTALMALGIIDELEATHAMRPIGSLVHNGPDHLHMVIEALRLAFAETRQVVCDPGFGSVPVERLLSREHLGARARLFDADRAVDVGPGLAAPADTVYFAVVDGEGNACSFVNSLFHGFGSGVVPDGCGFALHDRGCLFSLDPSHANALAPSKRPYHTILPALATHADSNELDMVFGIMGGHNQPQAQIQILLNTLRFGMNPQAALDAPRASIQIDAGERVAVEDGITAQVAAQLCARGHSTFPVKGMNRSMFGRGQIIRVHSGHVLEAGSDPRSDGQAVGR